MRTTIAMLLVSVLFMAAGLGAAGAADAPPKTVVLVHGAFASASSWNKVIPLLKAKGLNVVAVDNPLTSLADHAIPFIWACAKRSEENRIPSDLKDRPTLMKPLAAAALHEAIRHVLGPRAIFDQAGESWLMRSD